MIVAIGLIVLIIAITMHDDSLSRIVNRIYGKTIYGKKKIHK